MSNPFYPHEIFQFMIMYHETTFGCKRISSSEDNIVQMTVFSLYEPSLWPWPWQQNNLFKDSGSWYYDTKFGYNRLNSSEDTIKTHIQQSFELLLWSWPSVQQTVFPNLWHEIWSPVYPGWTCFKKTSSFTLSLSFFL